MTGLEQAIQSLEHGLLPLPRGQEPPDGKMDLEPRMARLKVPGFSLALAKGCGLAEAGCRPW